MLAKVHEKFLEDGRMKSLKLYGYRLNRHITIWLRKGSSNDDLIAELVEYLVSLKESNFRDGIKTLEHR
ncbi:hypothetical protein NPIL_56261 [Nephila pilipes]|uniref:Uncharacterized protein n=1 Tax=Nephila pilipes TaxID=299642 RepID=A0A8X6TNU4_NEPPI|nr:hypothetical protein NPIL_56261 [Nephila pilipes]